MKSQAGLEFYAAILIFVLSVTYIFIQIIMVMPKGIEEIRRQTLMSEAFQISEILIKDFGEPANWYSDLSTAKRIGLANESFTQVGIISYQKAIVANNTCNSNYDLFKRLLGINYDLGLVLVVQNNPIINCTKSYGGASVVKISRFIALENKSYGELTIWLY